MRHLIAAVLLLSTLACQPRYENGSRVRVDRATGKTYVLTRDVFGGWTWVQVDAPLAPAVASDPEIHRILTQR